MDPDWRCISLFPIENGDIPASYVSLPEGSRFFVKWSRWWFQRFIIFTPKISEMIQFDGHIFPDGWVKNHQPGKVGNSWTLSL